MAKRLIIQMDAPESFLPATDSTLALALEAQNRGYAIFYYTPSQLAAVNGEIVARARAITFSDRAENFFEHGEEQTLNLETADVILIRQNPPYNMEYLTCLWLLERLQKPYMLNNPAAIRNRPEKIFPLDFPHYTPPTCISADIATLLAFRAEYPDAVVKPLYGFGGADIEHFAPANTTFEATIVARLKASGEPLIVQPYLPEVMTQEKRILLINGEIAAAYNRIPAAGDFRSNGAAGGSAAATKITPRQREIATAVGAVCKAEGLMLVGLDVIGDWLIEINTTCPTGLRVANRLYGTNLAAQFWDAVEKPQTS